MRITGKPGLTLDEIEALLRETAVARLATHGPGRRINLSPLWFCWAEDRAYAYTRGQKVANLRQDPFCTLTVDRNERYPELHGVMLEGRATVLEDAAAEAADPHLDAVVRDRMGAKYAAAGFGSGPRARNESTAMGKSWRWVVFVPERAFTWDNRKAKRRGA